MTTRRRNRGPTVSLFPFLSVLAVVIGTLTLIISGISLGEITTGSPQASEEYARLQNESAACEQESTELQALIAQAEALTRELEEKRALVADLQSLQKATDEEQARIRALIAELETLQKSESEVQHSLAEVQQDLAAAEMALADATKQAEDNKDRLLLTGSGSGAGLAPSFIECTAEGLVLNAQAEEGEQILVRKAEIEDSFLLNGFLRQLKGKQDGIAVCVIRPGGVASFDQACLTLDKSGATYGYMAAPGHQALDYGLFVAK